VVGSSGFLGRVSPFFFFDIKIQMIPIATTATIIQNNIIIICAVILKIIDLENNIPYYSFFL